MEFRRVCRNILTNNMRDLTYSEVLIKTGVYTYPFAVNFAIESQILGKKPFIQIIDDTYYKGLATEIPPSNIRFSNIERQAIEAADLIVWFSPYQDSAPKMPLEQEKAIQLWEKEQELACRKKKILWMTYPSKKEVQTTSLSLNILEEKFLSALTVPSQKIKTIGTPLLEKMQTAEEIEVKTSSYELVLNVKNRKVELSSGYFAPDSDELYLPAGEVCVAPLETGTDGKIVFNHPTWGIHHLFLEFERGQVVDFHAKKGEKIFKRFLETATGNPEVIAEFAFGINPACKPMGWFLLDEIALGTIHLAIGENRHLGGINESSLHKDFISKEASVCIDAEQVMHLGKLSHS
ncbi:MAG: aminopeptidase [Candidatus Hodarchaeota archaeon]